MVGNEDYYFRLNKSIEKKSLFKTSMNVGTALFGMLVLNFVLIYALLLVFSKVLNIGYLELASLMQKDLYIGYGFNVLITCFSFTIPFILAVLFSKRRFTDVLNYNLPENKKTAFISIIVCFCVGMLANEVVDVIAVFTQMFSGKTIMQPTIEDNPQNVTDVLFMLFATALVPAIVEEFAFRGVTLGLLRKFGDMPAIVVSSVLFAFMHSNFIQLPFALIVGVSLGITAVINDSIIPCIAVHFLINAFAVFANGIINPVISVLFMLVCAVLGLIFVVLVCRKLRFVDVPSYCSQSERTFRLLFSPSVILCCIIFLYTATQYVA